MQKLKEGFSRAWNSRAVGISAGAVALVVFGVVIAAIVLAFTAPAKPGAQDPQPSQPTTEPATRPTSDNGECNVPVGDTSLRPKLPADLRWEAAQGLTWPVSATGGPTRTKDGFPVCFARSPLGAALAATTMLYSQYNGHTPREMMQFYVVDSAGKTALLGSAGGSSSSAGDLAKLGANPMGFIADEYSPDRAGISLVFSVPQSETGYVGIPTTLVWVNGDWRLKLLDNGSFGTTSKPVEGQFVKWRPTNG